MNNVLITTIFASSLTLFLGILLCVFRRIFYVETDVLAALVRDTLPGANCGACGYPGCDGFAAAVAAKEADAGKCTVSSAEDTKKRAELAGGMGDVQKPLVAVVGCQGTAECAHARGVYTGVKNCRGAKIASNGVKVCAWGCIGFGDCARVCALGAISFGENGLPVIDRAKCHGCKRCVIECPQGLIKLMGADEKGSAALCNNRSTVKASVRKACAAGCIKCELCVKKCPAGALTMTSGIPVTDYTKCTGCGECVAKCPQKVMRLLNG